MTRLMTTLAIAVLATSLSACDAWLVSVSVCGQEQQSCAEQQHATCAAPGPLAREEPVERNLRLEVTPSRSLRACGDSATQNAHYSLQRYEHGDGRGSSADLALERDEGDCHLTFEVRVEEYDPKLERDVLVGGADARVRLCRAELVISHAPSYGDLSPQLVGASIRSGDDMRPLLQQPVGLSIVEPGFAPAGCGEPLGDRELDEVYQAWDLDLTLTLQELQRLFGGVERPALRTTWLIEEIR